MGNVRGPPCQEEKRLERINDCHNAAERFIQSCICLTAQDVPDKIVAEIMDFKRNIITVKTGAKSVPHVYWEPE